MQVLHLAAYCIEQTLTPFFYVAEHQAIDPTALRVNACAVGNS